MHFLLVLLAFDAMHDVAEHGAAFQAAADGGAAMVAEFAERFCFIRGQAILPDELADKPAEVVPEAPEATNIPTAYIVSCVTENSNHGADTMDLIADTFTIGDVTKDGDNYVCPITIATAKYAEAYSLENGKHTAKEASITFNMTWDNTKWVVPEKNELSIAAFCAPAMTAIPTQYIVSCEKHESAWVPEIPGTVKIGEVTQQPSGDYVCTITVSTADYAEEYSKACGEHKATVDSVSYTMAWNGRKWVAPAMTELPVIAI